MATQMIVRVDEDTKLRFDRLVRAEGRNTSQVVREMMGAYIVEHDVEGYVASLWDRIGGVLAARNPGRAGDVDRAIKAVRRQKEHSR